jgi:hypothetical protein
MALPPAHHRIVRPDACGWMAMVILASFALLVATAAFVAPFI